MVGFTLIPSNRVFNLPIDLVYIITDHICDYKNIIQLSQVNRGLHDALWKEPKFWQRLWQRNISVNIPEESEGEIRSKYLSVLQRLKAREQPYRKLCLAVKEGWEGIFNRLFDPDELISREKEERDYRDFEYDRWIREKEDKRREANTHKTVINIMMVADSIDDVIVHALNNDLYYDSEDDDSVVSASDFATKDDTVKDEDTVFDDYPVCDRETYLNKLLIIAIYYGHITLIEKLLDNGADMRGEHYDSLALATRRKNMDVIKYLINRDNKRNEYPLVDASEYGNLDAFDLFVKLGQDITVQNNEALVMASWNGHLDIVDRLIELGADVCSRNYQAFWMALDDGRYDIVAILVHAGVDITIDNYRPLRSAIEHRHVKIVRLLLKSGSEPIILDGAILIKVVKRLHEPDDYDSFRERHKAKDLAIIRLLLEYNADPNAQQGQALRVAVQNESIEAIRILLDDGADIYSDVYEMACKNEQIKEIIESKIDKIE